MALDVECMLQATSQADGALSLILKLVQAYRLHNLGKPELRTIGKDHPPLSTAPASQMP